MRHAVAIFTMLALATATPAQAKPKERAPRFADYPVAKVSHMRVAKPKIPESWDEDPRLRFQDSVHDDSRANFAGHYFVAIWGCGSTCVWGGIVEAKSGRIIELPSVSGWFDTHDSSKRSIFGTTAGCSCCPARATRRREIWAGTTTCWRTASCGR
jgi:hypothetical protein